MVGIGLLLAGLTLPNDGQAQSTPTLFTSSCLATPNRNVNYDESLDQAVKQLRSQNVELSYGGAGLNMAQGGQDTTENRKALHIVQTAIADRSVALMESCLFYGTSCATAASDQATARSAINLVRSLCTAALTGSAPTTPLGFEKIVVSPSPFRFINLQPGQRGKDLLFVENLSGFPASFNVLTRPNAPVRFAGSCSTTHPECRKPQKPGVLDLAQGERRVAVFDLAKQTPGAGYVYDTVEFAPAHTPQGFVTEPQARFSVEFTLTAVEAEQRVACTRWGANSDCLHCEIRRGPAYQESPGQTATWACPRMAAGSYKASIEIMPRETTAQPGARSRFTAAVRSPITGTQIGLDFVGPIDIPGSHGGAPCDPTFLRPITGQFSGKQLPRGPAELRIAVGNVARCNNFNGGGDDGSVSFPEEMKFELEQQAPLETRAHLVHTERTTSTRYR